MDRNKSIGLRIKTMRLSRKMTQADLALAIGQSQSSITMYESGRRRPDFETLEALADVFNVTLASIVSDEDPDDVAAKLREPPPCVVVPDSALFVKAMEKMTPEDVVTLTGIFNRAIAKIKEEEENNK